MKIEWFTVVRRTEKSENIFMTLFFQLRALMGVDDQFMMFYYAQF